MTTPQILHITGLQKVFGPKLVLDDLSLLLNRGDRMALVGENGSGKTTLARIIAGIDKADDGLLNFTPGASVGYLPQEATLEGSASVGQYVARITGDLDVLQAKMRDLEARMSEALSDDELDSVLVQYGELQAQFERLGGYDLEDRMAQVFAGLDISYIDSDRLLGTLSGGEKTRVALAALLLSAPDLLVLDEPTNHLDFSGIEWLEAYLAGYPNALLMISHDRAFINRIVNQIAEMSPVQHNLTLYHGDYDAYLQQREQRYQAELAAYESQRDEMSRLRQLAKQKAFATKRSFEPSGDKFYDGFKGGRNDRLISKGVRDVKQRLATLEDEKLDNPNRQWLIRYDFDPVPLGSAEPLRLTGLSKQFGDQVLFEDLTATILNGERIVLVAPNGAGKSTLLKIIMQQLAPDSGQVTVTQSAIPGYLDQEAEGFDLSQNVLDAYRNAFPGVPPVERDLLATLHRCGLFTDGLLQDKAVGDLSMGQRRKLGIACLIASRANLLLLDEPTNHLDFASLEALEDALTDFPGVIFAVSHDRRFVEHVATQVWTLHEGMLHIERRQPV